MSRGRILSGFARGVPREYNVYDVSMGGIARALRGSGRHHPEGLDRAEVLPRGQVLVVQGHRDLAAALPAAASAGVGAVHRLARKPSSGPASTISARCIPDHQRGLTAGHRRLLRQAACQATATRSRRSTCASSPTPMWRTTSDDGDQGIQPVLSLLRAHALAPRLDWRRRRRRRAPAICRRRRSTTCGRRTASAPASTARR